MKIVKEAYIYLITYPNGKIYIGQDRTNDINYFGSGNGALIEIDFTSEQRMDFTIRKQILEEYVDISIAELNNREKYFITLHQSNNPGIGYNRYPGRKNYPRKTQEIYEDCKN